MSCCKQASRAVRCQIKCAIALVIGLVFAGAFFTPHVFATNQAEKRVLFISSYTLTFPTVSQQIEGINAALSNSATIEYLFMDTKALRDTTSSAQFYMVCKNKLAHGGAYDVVILGDDAALHFGMEYQDDLFAGVPLVFEGVNNVTLAQYAVKNPLVAGIVELAPYENNIKQAMKLYPDATKITAIVDSTETGAGDETQFMEQAKLFPEMSFSVINSSQMTQPELETALRSVTPDTILFFFDMNDNVTGAVYSQTRQMEIIRSITAVPVFRMLSAGMGQGFAGGEMISFVEMGRAAGNIALQILNGADTARFRLVMQTPTVILYDYAVLRTFGFTKKDVSPNAVFVNDPLTFWQHYSKVLWPVLIAFLLLMALTAYLLLSSIRYSRTVRALRVATSDLTYAAHFDSLTNTYRRSYFFECTQEMLRLNPTIGYVIFRTDLYHFRVVNELHGSDEGDRVLREFGRILRAFTGASGTCAHFQADNFVGCVPAADFSAQDFLRYLDDNLHGLIPGHELLVRLGLYAVEDSALPVMLMCDHATTALHNLHGSVLTRFAWYDASLRNTMMLEQQIINDMGDALIHGDFHVYYQPIYDLITEKPVSAEALARWQHPIHGMMSPGVFIPIMERNGFIPTLDNFVCEQVCRLQGRLALEKRAQVPVSLNLSRADFGEGNLSDTIPDLAAHWGVPSGMLKLEVTETAYTDSPYQLIETTDRLRKKGFAVLMDDFGSGYSSLNMLKDIPMDVLKLDICFLQDFDASGRTAAIMSHVVSMAKGLDMYVIAEGVETAEQVAFLRGIGCDAAQGYYYAKPMPEDAFCALLQEQVPPPEAV